MADPGDLGDPMFRTIDEIKLMENTDPATDMPPEVVDLEEGEEEDQGEGPPKISRFDALFAEEKKKKKKKKTKKKVKPPPPKRPTKAEYENVIAELNKVLVELSKRVMALDESNLKRNSELVNTKNDHKEVAEHLKRVLAKHVQNHLIEVTYNEEIKKKREELATESKATIKSWQTRYNQTQSQLMGEIEMLTIKLSTLRVFTDAREEMLKKLGDIEIDNLHCDQLHKDRLYAVQQKAVVERNKLDKEAKSRFKRIVNDFNDWREVRNAAYKRRLLTENKELRSKYNKLMPLNLKKERDLDVVLEKTASIRETHAAVFDITLQLENTQAKRNALLEKLEKYKRFYKLQVILGSKYRRLYESIKKEEMKENQKLANEAALIDDLNAQCEMLTEKLQILKAAEHDYFNARLQYDLFVNGVKYAIYSLCNLPEFDYLYPQSFMEYEAKRNIVLRGLVDLITSSKRKLTTKALLRAQYYKGYLGFIPFDAVICQIFKCINCSGSMDSGMVPSYCLHLSDWSGKKEATVNKEELSDPGLLCLK